MRDTTQTVAVLNTNASEEMVTLSSNENHVRCVEWSPDGRFIASGYEDGTISIWDAKTGEELRWLNGQSGAVLHVRWSPDSSRIASTTPTGTVRVWDIETGAERVLHSGGNSVFEVQQGSGNGQHKVDVPIDNELFESASDGELPSHIIDSYPAYPVEASSMREPDLGQILSITILVIVGMFILMVVISPP